MVSGLEPFETLPARLLEAEAEAFGMVVAPPPVEIRRFTSSIAWHARDDKNALVARARERLLEVAGG
jgi:hypothetical protein